MIWAISIVALFIIGLLAASWHMSDLVLHPKTRTVDNSFTYMVERGHLDPEIFKALPKEELIIPSPHGYDLYGIYIPVQGSRQTVIIAHGITATLYHAVKYMHPYRNRGYNVLLIEHRNHGHSGGSNTTYGFYEKDDVRVWVDMLQARGGNDLLIGIHGESMGAAIALQAAAIDKRISFVVADCSFASAREQFAYRLKAEYGLPSFPLIAISSTLTKLRTGFAFRNAAPIDRIAALTIPVFFIHGVDDTYIPPDASRRLYHAKAGYRKLWLAPNAGHAESQPNNPEQYDSQIGEFLAEMEEAYRNEASFRPEGDNPLR